MNVLMVGAFVMVLSLPRLRTFLAVDLPGVLVAAATVGVVSLAYLALLGGWMLAAQVRRWSATRSAPAETTRTTATLGRDQERVAVGSGPNRRD